MGDRFFPERRRLGGADGGAVVLEQPRRAVAVVPSTVPSPFTVAGDPAEIRLKNTAGGGTNLPYRFRVDSGGVLYLERELTGDFLTDADLITISDNIAYAHWDDDGVMEFTGGKFANEGGTLRVYGKNHSTKSGYVEFYTPNAAKTTNILRAQFTGGVNIGALKFTNINQITFAAFISFLNGQGFLFQNESDNASNEVLRLSGGNRSTAADGDEAFVRFTLDADNEVQAEFGRMTWIATDGRVANKDGTLEYEMMVDNSLVRLLALNGGTGGTIVTHPVTAKTGNYTATINDGTILCDASGGGFTITLPAAAAGKGLRFDIKKTDSSGNTVIVDGDGSETIDGTTTKVLTSQGDSIPVESNGTAWHIL